jgi:hypothetical protein
MITITLPQTVNDVQITTAAAIVNGLGEPLDFVVMGWRQLKVPEYVTARVPIDWIEPDGRIREWSAGNYTPDRDAAVRNFLDRASLA